MVFLRFIVNVKELHLFQFFWLCLYIENVFICYLLPKKVKIEGNGVTRPDSCLALNTSTKVSGSIEAVSK